MSWSTPAKLLSFPNAIIHVDGDAFFASCEQAIHPEYRGKPVITGKERGIVSAASYEAKKFGIKRGVPLGDVKKLCPDAIIVPSDYETYSLFSKRMFAIIRRYTDIVEEYGIDEAFADITGMRGPHHMGYMKIARDIKNTIQRELNLTVSVGLAPTKVLAKIGSKWQKPNGFTAIPGRHIEDYLKKLPVERVWGIGYNTANHLHQFDITMTDQFTKKSFDWVAEHFPKPIQELWHELQGVKVYDVVKEEKTSYASISKTRTFTPPSTDPNIVYAQLVKNVENACIKARRYTLVTKKIYIFLKTQNFSIRTLEGTLTRGSAYPTDMLPLIETMYQKLFKPGILYRATGVVLAELTPENHIQGSLFESPLQLK